MNYLYIKHIVKIALIFLFSLGCCSSIFAQLTITVDRNDAIYQTGETVLFNLEASTNGTVSYIIQRDRNASILDERTFDIESGQTYTITHRATMPGMVLCTVTYNNLDYIAAAAISPTDIQPTEKEPEDFDEFWEEALNELAAIPLDPEVVFFEEQDYINVYSLNLATVNNRRVYGYVSIPKSDGPFPAFLTLPPFGSIANIAPPDQALAERGGAISVTISIHNVPPNEVDPNSYEPDVINNPDSLYYKLAILAGVRAIDYIFTRDDFDGINVGVNGVSQGGGLAMCVAGLDSRVKLLAYSNSALCEHNGLKFDRSSGFPYYIRNAAADDSPTLLEETSDALKYIDAMYFCKRFTGPSLGVTGYIDTICPSSTVYAAFNQLRGPKILVQDQDLGHSHPGEYWNDRLDFYRRYFPAMFNPPWPWPGTTTGYNVSAGEDLTISFGVSPTLMATVENNTIVNPDWPVKWEVEQGTGKVAFASSDTYGTVASFAESGTYVLKFTAFDYSKLENEGKVISLTDYVTITVN